MAANWFESGKPVPPQVESAPGYYFGVSSIEELTKFFIDNNIPLD